MFRLTASAQFSVILSLLAFKSSSCSGQSASEPGEDTQTTAIPESVQSSTTGWPGFRGPGGMGISGAKGLPQTWSPDENIKWKRDLPGAGSSSPIIFDDHIYLTCWSGYLVPDESRGSLDDLKRHLVCLNRDDGAIVWDRPVKAALPEQNQIRDHGYAANTPAADSDRIYTFSASRACSLTTTMASSSGMPTSAQTLMAGARPPHRCCTGT